MKESKREKKEAGRKITAIVLDGVDVLEHGVAPVISLESAHTPNCGPASSPVDSCP